MSESGIREETVETTTSTQASQPKQLGKRSRADDEKSPPSSMRSSDSDVNDNGNNEPSVSVRVVSYNVLSSRLARADYFNHCDPSNLEAKVRLPRILQKIEDEMNRSSETTSSYTPPTIFCLQEVSREWSGSLHVFFANRGYHMVTGLYGGRFNGYMGIAVAYPTECFETLDVDVLRLADHREGEGWPRKPVDDVKEEDDDEKSLVGDVISMASGAKDSIWGITRKAVKGATRIATAPSRFLSRLSRGQDDKPPVWKKRSEEPWDVSENRHNVMVSVHLRQKTREWKEKGEEDTSVTKRSKLEVGRPRDGYGTLEQRSRSDFWIGNYHMPCCFRTPSVMNIHCEMAARRIQSLSARLEVEGGCSGDTNREKGTVLSEGMTTPYILAGDFNIMPDSPHYGLMVTGELLSNDPTCPPVKHGMEWSPDIRGMGSAYALYQSGKTAKEGCYEGVLMDDLTTVSIENEENTEAGKMTTKEGSTEEELEASADTTDKEGEEKKEEISSVARERLTLEPNYTNYARVGEDEPFIGTLDYIFLGGGDDCSDADGDDRDDNKDVREKGEITRLGGAWKVTGTKEVGHRDDVKDPPYPNADEPSDHVMISADLEL